MSAKYVGLVDGPDPQPGQAAIYVLRDPQTGEARYVGRTTQILRKRLKGHWRGDKGAGLAAWLDTLDSPPVLEAVMYVPVEQGGYWEGVVIAGMAVEGARLVNHQKARELCGTAGGRWAHQKAGEPVCRPCREVERAVARGRKRKRRSTPEYRAQKAAWERARRARKRDEQA